MLVTEPGVEEGRAHRSWHRCCCMLPYSCAPRNPCPLATASRGRHDHERSCILDNVVAALAFGTVAAVAGLGRRQQGNEIRTPPASLGFSITAAPAASSCSCIHKKGQMRCCPTHNSPPILHEKSGRIKRLSSFNRCTIQASPWRRPRCRLARFNKHRELVVVGVDPMQGMWVE